MGTHWWAAIVRLEWRITGMSKTSPRTPNVGDNVYLTDGANKNVKAYVLDPTPQKGGIKLQVVPADNSPFPIVAAYDANGAQGTWHWDKIKEDSDDA